MLVNDFKLEDLNGDGYIKKMRLNFTEERGKRRYEFDKVYNKTIYQNFKEGGDILFDDMYSHMIGVDFIFPCINDSSITSTRVESYREGVIKFISTFDKGAILARHTHGDSDEWIKVPKGSGGEFLIISGTEKSGTLEYNKLTEDDDGMLIRAGLVHQVSNTGKKQSKLIVNFKKVC